MDDINAKYIKQDAPSYQKWENLRSLEEVMDEIDNAPKWKHAWWAMYRALRWSTIRRVFFFYPRWGWQRLRRGWSDYDAYSFDHYLAGVIAGGLANIRDGHSHPCDMTAEEWESYLNEIITGLTRYRDMRFTANQYHEEMKAYNAAAAAMHKFADRFGDMWD